MNINGCDHLHTNSYNYLNKLQTTDLKTALNVGNLNP